LLSTRQKLYISYSATTPRTHVAMLRVRTPHLTCGHDPHVPNSNFSHRVFPWTLLRWAMEKEKTWRLIK